MKNTMNDVVGTESRGTQYEGWFGQSDYWSENWMENMKLNHFRITMMENLFVSTFGVKNSSCWGRISRDFLTRDLANW